MSSLVPGNVYSHKNISDSNRLSRELNIFPTPFKGIYYMPYESERNGWYITDPLLVIFKAAEIYLKSDKYYFGLYSALYYQRIIWNASGVDIINPKLSRKIIRKLPAKKYWRGKLINKLMASYSFPVRFHRIKNFATKGLIKRGSISFSNFKKTNDDAIYLCKKGDKTGCQVLKVIRSK